ncbi:MAG: hypothetical protein ACK5TG_07380 [Planctomyces sp.]|jgi:hypothetical protein|nr:hypothetical protein [Planctomyces sp.]GDX90893.1 hypothetical protein LBMAG46_08980 [Planctomycetia bacterium]HAV32819.1 hypothetical protein [Planctomycetaceae bacterium]HBC62296.1 hypothetical protein [Planctomycetaceae bacterium]
MDEQPQNVPLVERFHRAEHLARELSEHLQQSLLPRISALRHAAKVHDAAQVSDQEMHDHMSAFTESEAFASGIHEKLRAYLLSIEQETRRILNF